jgi:hypothetical protein
MAATLAQKYIEDLTKALGHLEYSFKKASRTLKQPILSEDDLKGGGIDLLIIFQRL